MLDCETSLPLPRDEMTVAFSEHAFTGFFPMTNGRCRVLGTVPRGLEGTESITFDDIARDFDRRMAWKFALMAQGKAGEEVLDTYHEERIAIARNLVQTTDRAFNYVNSQHPLLKGFRLRVMPIAMRAVLPAVQHVPKLREAAFATGARISSTAVRS